MKEDLVADDEYYPKNNAIEDLQNVCRWATAAGMYIIIDLHGLPGAQQKEQPFTGRVSTVQYLLRTGEEKHLLHKKPTPEGHR